MCVYDPCAAYWRDVGEHLMNMCMYEEKRVTHWLNMSALEKWIHFWIYLPVIVWGSKRLVKSIFHSQFVGMCIYENNISVHTGAFVFTFLFMYISIYISIYSWLLIPLGMRVWIFLYPWMHVWLSYIFVWILVNLIGICLKYFCSEIETFFTWVYECIRVSVY